MFDINSVISIQTIMSIRLFCGFYYNICSNKLVNLLVRAYCVFIATLLILHCYTITKNDLFLVKLRFGLLSTVHATNVFISLLFSGENLFIFLKKIRKITPALKPNAEIPLSQILFIFIVFCKVMNHFLYAILTSDDLFNAFSEGTLSTTLELFQLTSNFTRIIMFEVLWHRMAMLRKQLEKNLATARRFQEGEVVMKKSLRSCMNTYKTILNTTQETDAPMKFMIFSSTVLLIPKVLNTVYIWIVYPSTNYGSYVVAFEALTEFIVAMSPALLAEMVNSEIDKMKLCVVKQLLVCRGDATRDAVDDAIMYFRQHPFKYSIWRLFTVDVGMILNVIALLTTYTVAMVQFAHFYN